MSAVGPTPPVPDRIGILMSSAGRFLECINCQLRIKFPAEAHVPIRLHSLGITQIHVNASSDVVISVSVTKTPEVRTLILAGTTAVTALQGNS